MKISKILPVFLFTVVATFSGMADNPFVKHMFTADPTARVMNGKLYVFPSSDIVCAEGKGSNGFCMPYYHVFSTENMFDWQDHGRKIDQNDVPWGIKDSYGMWAPDCVQVGKKYYYYFPGIPADSSSFRQTGVAVADSPTGPFKLEPNYMKGAAGIDPNVFIDDDGQAYLYFGGGEKLFVAQLNKDMKSLKTEAKAIEGLPAKYKEGPFMFKRNGIYYFTFPHSPAGSEELAYATGTNPMGPFDYKGLFMKRWTDGCWTNHHSVVEYKGQWLVFYHHHDISKNQHLRSICADYLNFNADGTIQEVIPTMRGIGICPANRTIQVDRYSMLSEGKAQVHLIKNAPEANWMVDYTQNNGWVKYDRVDFAKANYKTVKARVSAAGEGGTLEIRLGGNEGKLLATLEVKNTGGWDQWKEISAAVSAISGIQNIACVFKGGEGYLMNLDWIQFE